MKSFKVTWENIIDANTPLEAAKEALRSIQEDGCLIFVVEDDKTVRFTVDLDEEDEDAVLPE